MLEESNLRGKRFLDVGSGLGLSSPVARRLGATVHSFDFDPQSVACTGELKRRYYPNDPDWIVEEGSILDKDYLQTLGQWDIVYSWGVLHHTGAMWEALANVTTLVAKGGKSFIAIYNDQGRASMMWKKIKTGYNFLPGTLKWLILLPAFIRLWGPTTLRDLIHGRPGYTWRSRKLSRGMDPWRDVIDWVGGCRSRLPHRRRFSTSIDEMGFSSTG